MRTRLAHKAAGRDDSELVAVQLSRNRLYFGEAGQKALSDAFVVVVGLGGVGSHAAHMMARAGVGKLRLIDFDQLTLSSLNRHAVGTRDDVGRPKVCSAMPLGLSNWRSLLSLLGSPVNATLTVVLERWRSASVTFTTSCQRWR